MSLPQDIPLKVKEATEKIKLALLWEVLPICEELTVVSRQQSCNMRTFVFSFEGEMNLIQEMPTVNKRRLGLDGGTVGMISSDQGG